MAFDKIEKIKTDYTDLYVTLVDSPPELTRFVGLTGQVKTVNMNGRALVEWLGYHANIGWYDIDLDYLKVVEKPPEPEPVGKKPAAKKPAATKPSATAKTQAAKSAATGSPAEGKKLSPLEILRQQKKSSGDNSEDKN